MLPGRDDIALPPFAPGVTWIGDEPPVGERLTARGPLLVHFFEAGELSGIRTLPFIGGLATHYADQKLTVLGVHSPRSGLAESDEALAEALELLDVEFPVANDREHRIWHAYGCEGWPSTFLWGRGGKLRWVHFGEGAYHETEGAIRAGLSGDPDDLPASAPRAAPQRARARAQRAERRGLPRRRPRPPLAALRARRAARDRVRGGRSVGGPRRHRHGQRGRRRRGGRLLRATGAGALRDRLPRRSRPA